MLCHGLSGTEQDILKVMWEIIGIFPKWESRVQFCAAGGNWDPLGQGLRLCQVGNPGSEEGREQTEGRGMGLRSMAD